MRKLALVVQIEGAWALAVYRFGRMLRTRGGAAVMLWPLFRSWELAVRLLTGIHLDVGAEIGPGFYVGHHGAITVGRGVVIGENSSIGQMCWVAAAEGDARAPRLGPRVYIGPGAKVFGPVFVGEGAAIGAGAVVLDDVPARSTAVGNPARVIGGKGSEGLIFLGEGEPPKTGVRGSDVARARR